MSIDASAFKKAMRRLTASVTVITTRHQDIRGGLTATAFCSVSADPAHILICVNGSASAHGLIKSAGYFCVNILTPDQRQVAERFAGMDGVKGDKRFVGLGAWSVLTTGASALKDRSACFDCRTVSAVVTGTHTIYIGEVVDIALDSERQSLIYCDGAFMNGENLRRAAHAQDFQLGPTGEQQ